MNYTASIVNVANENLENTVDVFQSVVKSSENVIQSTSNLQSGLDAVNKKKDILQQAMNELEVISNNSVKVSHTISNSAEKQERETVEISTSMRQVKHGMEQLVNLFNENKE